MKDRVSTYPGRVTLTPVSGQANTYTLARADDPTEVGTPLNKATFLSDEVASVFGLGEDAVPSDALLAIFASINGISNSMLRIAEGYYIGTGGDSAYTTQTATIILPYAPKLFMLNQYIDSSMETQPRFIFTQENLLAYRESGNMVTWYNGSTSYYAYLTVSEDLKTLTLSGQPYSMGFNWNNSGEKYRWLILY